MNFTPLTAGSFRYGVYEFHEEAADAFSYNDEVFDMQSLLSGEDLVGGVSPAPTFPDVVSMDLSEPLGLLQLYTSRLSVFAAPFELCVQKALELMRYRSGYQIAVEAFRMELLAEVVDSNGNVDSKGMEDVNALVKGVQCVSDHILAYFDRNGKSNAAIFPYEFYDLHHNRYLVLTKIVFDATIPSIRPATVAKPAYSYPEVQARNRADHSAQADLCGVF